MSNVLAIDLGTYCDNRLAEIALSAVIEHYQVIYLTDAKHKLSDPRIIKIPFDTPSFFVNDPHLKVADPKASFVGWVITNPTKVYTSTVWSLDMRDKILQAIETYDPVCVLMMSSALAIAYMLHKAIKIPIYLIHVSPSIPSHSIPFLFDSDMRDPTKKLYVNTRENVVSGLTNLDRAAAISVITGTRTKGFDVFKRLRHIICYDDVNVPAMKLYRPSEIKVMHVGGLLPENITTPPKLKPGSEISKFVSMCRTNKSDIIMVSFGSYGCVGGILDKPLGEMMRLLVEFGEKKKMHILFHNGGCAKRVLDAPTSGSKHLHIIDGFIPYERVVPMCKIVVFTGSVCLQNICLYNAVPMLFFPLLAEQFYWAKNYKHHTGIPYVDFVTWDILKNDDGFFIILQEAMRVNEFLVRVQKNMKRIGHDTPPKRILDIVKKLA
jgi:hypothetical protein